jgi:hypothetical protein
VLVSLCYVLLRWLLDFVVLRVRSKELKELEIVVLRHELAILRRKTRRPAITAVDGAPPEPVGRRFFTVETIWLQRLYILFFIELESRCARGWVHTTSERALGRPASAAVVVDLAGARGTHQVSDSRPRSEIHRAF